MKQWLGRLRSPQGLQGRWLKNILSLVVAVVIIAGMAFTLAAAAYSYTAMRTGLETKAKTTMAFFRNYLDLSYDECYESCVLLTQDFEDKNIIELQFINARGELITSSYGLFHMDDPDTADVKSALEGQTMGYFVGSDPATRERIMAVSAPLVYSDGRVVGALRFVCHFLSGIFLWGSYQPTEGWIATLPTWLYSIVYNGAYMLPEVIITVIGAVLLVRGAKQLFDRQAA